MIQYFPKRANCRCNVKQYLQPPSVGTFRQLPSACRQSQAKGALGDKLRIKRVNKEKPSCPVQRSTVRHLLEHITLPYTEGEHMSGTSISELVLANHAGRMLNIHFCVTAATRK